MSMQQAALSGGKRADSYISVSTPYFDQSTQHQVLWAERTLEIVHDAKIIMNESHSQLGTS